jgi:dicarboxylate/amino acid:cation (Na+ or H+) symporter, DAACS family
MGLAGRTVLGLLLGVIAGALLRESAPGLLTYVAEPMGTIFMRLLMLFVIPLASTALILGVLEVEPRAVLRMGGRALGLTLGLTLISVAIGIGAVTLFEPGVGTDPASLPRSGEIKPAAGDPLALLLSLFSDNFIKSAANGEMIAVLVASLIFAIAMHRVDTEGSRSLRSAIQGLFDVSSKAIHMVLALAPFGVFALAYKLGARGGLEALVPLGRYVLVVLGALGVQLFIVYPLALKLVAGRDPLAFFRAVRPAMAVAFSTSSSAATLPTSLEVAEKGLGLSAQTARFVLTVGATANQNGTALFEGVSVLFCAQLYGVELSLAQQAAVIGIAVGSGIGMAGVPGGALPVIAGLLVSLGIPAEAVGLIVGVDRLLDMSRTTLNVTGDLVIAAAVEGSPAPGAPPERAAGAAPPDSAHR